ncbi:MAG: flagellar hook assembly protein FlgD [Silvanigrellaceae bacterium]
MFSVTNKPGPFVAPMTTASPAFEEAKKQREESSDKFNFDKVIGASNNAIAEQLEADKKSLGEGGELKIGESKNDKEFREMLERVSGRKQDKLKNKLDKDDYLNLMVTQLKYQDPTKPMENHEMATQLAQFNTVEQLINVNKSLTDMANKSAQGNIDKLTPYLGKLVEVSGSKLKVGSDQKISQGSIELAAPSGSVSVLIKDSSGTVVRTLGLGEKDIGRHTIEWDGKTDGGIAAKPGEYNFEVNASSIDGKEMKVKTSFVTKVDAITDLASGGKLETASGAVEAKDILSIRPDNSEAASQPRRPESSRNAERPVKNDKAAEEKNAASIMQNKEMATASPERLKEKPSPAKEQAKEKSAVTAEPAKQSNPRQEAKTDTKPPEAVTTGKTTKTESKKAI